MTAVQRGAGIHRLPESPGSDGEFEVLGPRLRDAARAYGEEFSGLQASKNQRAR